MTLTTYRFRLKDSSGRNRLRALGCACHDGWNYCNETTAYQWSLCRSILSVFDLHQFPAGVGKERERAGDSLPNRAGRGG